MMWGDGLDYTEKEQKSIDKVARMNRFFDKVLMPTVGVLIIITLLFFIVDRVTEKWGKGANAESAAVSGEAAQQPEVFALRAKLLADYEKHTAAFADYGYEPVEGYAQDLALCKTVDDELTIYQFSDSALGDFTIVRYVPSAEKKAPYDSLSLTVSSETLLSVMMKQGEQSCAVAFTSVDFSSYKKDDSESYDTLMKTVSDEELKALYEIFETDIENLSKKCG